MEQNGNYKIDCRFNKKNLAYKIKNISTFKNRIKLYNMDVKTFIPEVINRIKGNAFVYLDPPYIIQGSKLYSNYFQEKDHKELSRLIKSIKLPWILTYDKEDLVYNMYTNYKISEINLNYSAARKRLGTELMVYSNNIVPA